MHFVLNIVDKKSFPYRTVSVLKRIGVEFEFFREQVALLFVENALFIREYGRIRPVAVLLELPGD